MSVVTFRKHSGDGIQHAVMPLGDVDHVLATVVPRGGCTFRQQAEDALEAIAGVMAREGANGALVNQTVFLTDVRQIAACRQIFREFYGPALPAINYVPQPPCGDKLLAIEALGLGGGRTAVQIKRLNEQVVVARHGQVDWVYAAQAVPRTSAPGVYEESACAFQRLRRLLPDAGVHVDQIIRAWFYLGGIVEPEDGTQRYKEFNRARADFYEHIPFLADRVPAGHGGRVFPASTGIGTLGHGLCMSAIAVSTGRPDVLAVPLENPRQTAAYNYAADYSPQSPKFSRGMALTYGSNTLIFISGTASITSAETRHPGDVVWQTHETLNNIALLISEENLARNGLPGAGTSLDGLGLIRVYIKHPEDFARVRAVCKERLGVMPALYLAADVCRPDLLVEIEGTAFSCKDASPDIVRRRPKGRLAPRRRYRDYAGAAQQGNGCPFQAARPGPRLPCCPANCPERAVCPEAFLD